MFSRVRLGTVGTALVALGVGCLVPVGLGFAQELHFLHSEVVRDLPIAAGATDIAVFPDGQPAIFYEELVDTVAFSTRLWYAVRMGQGEWSVSALPKAEDESAERPRALVAGRTCHLFWLTYGSAQLHWARARLDTLFPARTLIDTTFGGHIGATRFCDGVLVGAFESRTGTGWGYRLFWIKGDAVTRVEFPYAKRWRQVVLCPSGKRYLYLAGRCGQAACLARTDCAFREWQSISLLTSERAEGLRLALLGGRVFLFWELGENGRLFTDVLRWMVVDADDTIAGPFTLYRAKPPAVLFDPVVITYRDRWLLVIFEEGHFSERKLIAYYTIYDGRNWTEIRPLIPDSSLGVGNVTATVDESGLIRFAYSGGDGVRNVVGYATARVEFPSSAGRVEHETPEDLGLQAPYPNPFNGATEIRFSLARPGKANLCVLDVRGRVVRRLGSGRWSAGPHALQWNGTDDNGQALPSGVLIVRLEAGGQVATRKVVLVR